MTMPTGNQDSQIGMHCTRCGQLLIAPEWSEYVNEGHVVNLWHCEDCDCRFDTTADFPAELAAENDAVAMRDFFPTLLVA